MSIKVSIHETQTHLDRLLAIVGGGTEVTIIQNDRPIAKLIPAEPSHRKFGEMDFEVPEDFDAPLPDSELAAWQ